MKKLIVLCGVALTVVLLTLPLVGCGGSEYRLSKSEKQKVVKIALNTPEVSERLEEEGQYVVRFMWMAVVWRDSEPSEVQFFYCDELEKRPGSVSESAVFYPGVIIYIAGQPGSLIVAVSLDTEQTVHVKHLSVYESPQFSLTLAEDSASKACLLEAFLRNQSVYLPGSRECTASSPSTAQFRQLEGKKRTPFVNPHLQTECGNLDS